MKKIYALLVLVVLTVSTFSAKAQEWSTGVDIYSSYIWRGAKFGSGPAFQPYVDFTTGGLSVGAWGSVNASSDEALEMDLYAGYSFDNGLSLTVTDYYFGGTWTDFSYSHYIEPSVSFSAGSFSLTGAAMLLPAADAVDAVAGVPAMVDLGTGVVTPAIEKVEAVEATSFGEGIDLYFEAGYSFSAVDLTLGAGNGAYTEDGSFNLCNVSVSTAKEIEITDKFTLPVSGSVTLNPSTGGFFIAVGISL